MNVRIIVPRRGDGGHRDRVWRYCADHWRREFPTYTIVEGEHTDGPFNRSAAINDGARGEWDVAVILDADVVLDPKQLAAGVARAAVTGKLVLPFRDRSSVSEAGTAKILDGYRGSWRQWVETRQTFNVSTCLCVPRSLWDDVGGFDERFVGWGGEDDAFHAACLALAGVERLPGTAWHLWHPVSEWRDWRSPLYTQAKNLADRYIAVAKKGKAEGMRRLLAEDRGPDAVLIVVLTNGRRATLRDTIESADAMVTGPIGRKLVIGDHYDPKVPGWDTQMIDGGRYWRAMHAAQRHAVGSGQPWIFWIEDDFTFDEPVDLAAMQAIMRCDDRLAQLSLMRQPWYVHEHAAGSVIASLPDHEFVQHRGYVAHQAYWTMNPMLTTRHLFASFEWPKAPNSERGFGDLVFAAGWHGGILGSIDDAPRVTHHGEQRASGLGH